MALRQKLCRPFVVESSSEHTHTVVFLHRFPESTPDEELPAKVLSAKRTNNHKTLYEQFPGVRWVFPFAKAGARPYGNLSAEDKAAVGLAATRTPYITQILLQEAERVGGLDKVVLGGQGETAIAGHEAMSSFPEISAASRDQPDEVAKFLRDTFYAPSWTDVTTSPRLAGFVGMHAEECEVTRDIASYSIASKAPNDPPRINTSIVVNTRHCFIHGGYKVHTMRWDGRRIDDFAKFLAVELGIYRVPDPERRCEQKPAEEKEKLTEVQKLALELKKEKKASKAMVDIIRQRIEADKVERKIRKDRERQARLGAQSREPEASEHREPEARDMAMDGEPPTARYVDGEPSEDWEASENDSSWDGVSGSRDWAPGWRAAGDANWEAPSGVHGEMSEARMRALGLIPESKMVAKEENT